MNTEPDTPQDEGGPGPVDPAVAAVARGLERLNRKLDALDREVSTLAQRLITVPRPAAAAPAAATPAEAGGEAAEGLRCWLLANDPGDAAAALVDLVEWLDLVYAHYPDSALSSCWLWHPAVVEELWWLRVAHAEAYDPQIGSSMRAGDWHDRQRPGVAKRVHAVLGKCQLSRHVAGRDRPGSVVAPPGTPLAEHAAAVAAAWATCHVMPEPSAAQLDDSAAYQRDHLWRNT